ncbi:MAG: ABC transporter substrate-binding protein [Ruminiclostridium sp.]
MRKRYSIIIVFCLILIMTVSCVRNDNTVIEKNGVKKEEIVIKWMVFGQKYKKSDIIFSAFNNSLQKKFPGTTVEFEVVPKENYKEKWDMKMATNEALDIAWMGNDLFNYTEEVKKGSLMALDYLLATYGENLKREIPNNLWELQVCDANTYGVPIPGALYRKGYSLVADEKLVNRYGDFKKIGNINRSSSYTTKECYEAFEDFLYNAKKRGEIGTGVSYQTFGQIADKGYEGIYGADSPFVIKIFDDKLVVYNKYELESYSAGFQTMASWYQKGYIRKDVADVLDPLSEDGKKNGSILFVDEYGENGTVIDRIPTQYEAVREDLEGYKYISYASCRNSTVIPKSSDNPQRAMEIIDYLVSDEGAPLYKLLANGIKKEDYIVLEDNRIARLRDNNNNLLYGLSQYTIGDVFQNYEVSLGEFKQLGIYNNDAIRSPLLGFDLDTRMIALEMVKINLIVDKYKGILSQGISDNWEEVYHEFITKMKDAGSDKVIEEMQKQINIYV